MDLSALDDGLRIRGDHKAVAANFRLRDGGGRFDQSVRAPRRARNVLVLSLVELEKHVRQPDWPDNEARLAERRLGTRPLLVEWGSSRFTLFGQRGAVMSCDQAR